MLMSQEVKKQYSKISVSIYVRQKLKTIQILSIFILQISHTVGDTEENDPFQPPAKFGAYAAIIG